MASGLPFAARGRTVNVALTQRSRRAIVLLLVASSLLSGCLARLVYLQLLQGAYHRSRADNNRISLLPIVADRGNILDRNGQPLATSRLARSVYLYPREQTEQQWQQTIPKLAQVLQVPAQDIWSKLKQNGYRSAMPVRISRNLSKSAFISLAEQANELPGIEVRAESSRYYPHGSVAAHALGYISEATADDLKQHPDYPPGMLVGQFGIERLANRLLEGVWGGQMLEVDATGQEVQVLGTKPAQAGENVQLTLDLDLQKTAEKALGNRRGAVVALDIKTGQVLALASGPTFDPNLFTRRITQSEWQALQDQADPFLNRALQGYPPPPVRSKSSPLQLGFSLASFQLTPWWAPMPRSTWGAPSSMNMGVGDMASSAFGMLLLLVAILFSIKSASKLAQKRSQSGASDWGLALPIWA